MKIMWTALAVIVGLVAGCAQTDDDLIAGTGQGAGWSTRPGVLVVIYNPVLEADDNKTLVEYYGWNDPDVLVEGYVSDVRECSHGQVNYRIAERIEHDEWAPLSTGFRYTDTTFKQMWLTKSFEPGTFDYVYMLEQNGVREKVENGQIDEVWLFGFPGLGCWESCMAGEGAIWCNGPVIAGFECSRPFVVMGFNYERGVDCMLEDLGHRAESILTHVYGSWNIGSGQIEHLWDRFTAYEKVCPGNAACGNVHFAPNSQSDYDWGNTATVYSTCDDWLGNFPDLTDETKPVDCTEWGNGDMRLHHKWWFRRFPHHRGELDGKLINWWKYVIEWWKYRT